MEKHWPAHEAEGIVLGTLHSHPTYPWLDGWHIGGTIAVEEQLYGKGVPSQIRFEIVCEWRQCVWWPPPSYTENVLRGIWMLRRVSTDIWGPSIPGQLGCEYPNERDYWVDYIRKYKKL